MIENVYSASNAANLNVGSLTVSGVQVPASGRVLVAAVAFNNDNYETVSNVRLNNSAATPFTRIGSDAITDDDGNVGMWVLTDPPVGTHSVTVNLSAALSTGDDLLTLGVWVLTDIDLTTPTRNNGASIATQAVASIEIMNVTTQAGDLVLAAGFKENNIEEGFNLRVHETTVQSWRQDGTGTYGDTGIGALKVATGTTTTIEWIQDPGDQFAARAVPFRRASPPPAPIEASLMSAPYPGASGDVADGAAIIPDPSNPSNSVVLGASKSEGADGGLYVLNMDGEILSSVTGFAANSVDWRDTTGLSGWDGRILVMTSQRNSGSYALRFFWFNRTTRALTSAGTIPVLNEPYGTCLGINDGTLYAYMTERGSDDTSPREFYQASLVRSGDTVSLGSIVRQFTLPSVVEGMTVADDYNALFMSQEDVGLFALDAGASGGDWSTRLTVDLVANGRLVQDVEDVAIADTADGPKVLVSSQGDNSYHVYGWDEVAEEYVHERRFTIARPDSTQVAGTDGLDVCIANLGPTFPNGLIVVHDEGPDPSRFAFVDAAEVFGGDTLPKVVGTESGGRTGPGTVTVTPPAGADYWVAFVVAPEHTPPSGWSLVQSWAVEGEPAYWFYESTGDPGAVWTYSTGLSVNDPVAVLVRGYSGVSGTAYASQHTATSPSLNATEDALAARVVFDFPDPTPLGYPTGATLNRAQVSQPDGTNTWSASIGIAEQEVTAGATGTAAWTVPAQYEPHALTLLLYGEDTDPPTPPPTDVTAVGGDHELTGGFTADPAATQFRGQWRRTDLVRPATTTQSSAPNHLRRISQENLPMPSGYTYDFTGDGVPYAQFDTGVRVTHNEFGGRYVTGGSLAGPWNTDTAANPPFTQGHGTGVAAMALGTTYGVAKEAILYSVNAGEEAGPTMDQYEAAAAWLIANKPANRTVALNISNGFPLDDIPRLEAFLDSLYLNGIATFVAAGNTNDELPYNAFQYRIFVVGASTQADVKASYSDYGDGIDLYAPISPTTTAGNQSNTATRTGDGTSEASPTAAGVALKILEGNPELAPWRLYEVLRSQAWEGKISGIPTGTNLLLNGNANTDEWSEFPVSGETFTLDGLDSNATYEVRFSQMVNGEWSDWSTADSATTLAPAQYALPEVVGTATGGRVGDGSFTVTPPAGADYWVAFVAAGVPWLTPPSGWSLVQSWAEEGDSPTEEPAYWFYESTGSPGSLWTYSPESANNPVAVLVRGYSGVSGTAYASQHTATSPSLNATEDALAARVVFDLHDAVGVPLTYPTEATLNRAQVSQPYQGEDWSASIGIAEQEVTAGATGTAAWTVPAQYEPHALTLLLYGETDPPDTDPPGPLSQIAAFKVEVATSNTITVPIGSGAGASMQEGDLLVIAAQWANNGTASPNISWGGTTPTTGLTNRVPWSSPSSGSVSSGVWTWPVQSGTTSLTLTFAGAPDDGNAEVIVLRNWEDISVSYDAWSAASETGAPPSRSTPSIPNVPAGSLVYTGIDMASGSETVTAVGGTVILDGGERNGIVAAYGATTSNGTVTGKTFTWPTSGAYRVRSWQLAVHPAPSPTVMYANVGATTDSGFTVAVKTLNAETVQVRAGGITGAAATVDSNGWAHASVTGLDPLTEYSYDLILDGSVAFNNWATTKTWPTPGTPTTFGFALASCFNPTNSITGTTTGSFDRIQARNPLLWIHGGDYHYEDNASTSTSSHIADMEKSLAYSSRLVNLHSASPVLYSPGDHDYGGNNVFQGAWTPATREAKLAVIPFHDRPDPTALYHSVVVGRVRFIMCDTRSKAIVDTTRLGSTQLAWLEEQLLEPEPVKIVWVDNAWIDTRPTDPGDDTWEHFSDERDEIAGYIENAVGQVIICHGDQHSLAIDDGSGNPWGGVPVIGGAPFKNYSSIKVASISDYSEGVWPTSEGIGVEQYMWCDVIDSGGTEITLDFSGRDTNDVERISLTVIAEVPEPPATPWRLKGGTVVYPYLKTSGGLVPLG